MHLTSWEAVHQLDKNGQPYFQMMETRIHNNRDPMPPPAICALSGPCKPTADEIATLDNWISQGAPQGNGCTPPPPPGAGGTWMAGNGGAGNAPQGGAGGVVYYNTGGV